MQQTNRRNGQRLPHLEQPFWLFVFPLMGSSLLWTGPACCISVGSPAEIYPPTQKHCPAPVLRVNWALKSMKIGSIGFFPQLKNTGRTYHLHLEWIWAANDWCKIHRVGGRRRSSLRSLEWVIYDLSMSHL